MRGKHGVRSARKTATDAVTELGLLKARLASDRKQWSTIEASLRSEISILQSQARANVDEAARARVHELTTDLLSAMSEQKKEFEDIIANIFGFLDATFDGIPMGYFKAMSELADVDLGKVYPKRWGHELTRGVRRKFKANAGFYTDAIDARAASGSES